MTAEIYAFFVERCVPYTLPAPWHRTPCDGSFVMMPEDRDRLHLDLREKFPVEELLDAGLVAVSEAEEVTWHPLLAPIGEPIWAIGNHPNGVLVRALIAGMRVLGREPSRALEAALVDFRQWSTKPNGEDGENEEEEEEEEADAYLFVAYSMADAAILRSLGFRTVPGDAWQLNRSQLASLMRALDAPLGSLLNSAELENTGSPEEDTEPRVLVFANWRLATLERQEHAAAVSSLAHLQHLIGTLELPIQYLNLWQLSSQELNTLSTQLEHLAPERIPQCLMRTLEADPQAVADPPAAAKPSAYELTLGRLKTAFPSPEALLNQGAHLGRRLNTAQLRMQALYDVQLAPILREGAKASSLFLRNLWLDLAKVMQLKLALSCRISDRIHQISASNGIGEGDNSLKDEQAELAALFKAERTLTQEINSCREQMSKDQSTAEAAASKRRPSGASDLWTTRSNI